MMKFSLIILFLFFSYTCFCQVISNNGSAITITSGINVNAFTLIISSGIVTNNGTVTLSADCSNSASVNGAGNFNIKGNWINNGTFTTTGTVTFNGLAAQSISGTGVSNFFNLKNSNTGSTLTAIVPVSVSNAMILDSSSNLDITTNSISGSFTNSGTGTLFTQNTSASPIPAGLTWSSTVKYNSSSAQTIVLGNYNNLDATGGNRTFQAGTIAIAGTFAAGSGTYATTGSTIDFNGTSAQTIPAFNFNKIRVSGGSTKTCGGNVIINNELELGANTTLALSSNNITLTSNATGTARVAAIPATASITYGTGRFIVQRYIPGRRKYRLITSSVTTSESATLSAGQENLSIWGNWQNSGNIATAGTGNIITGGTSADGFDQHTTTASVYSYDDVNRRYIGFTSANGKNTKYTPLKAGMPYYMFVYGDRTNSVITAAPANTVLSATGTLLTGDQAYTTSSSLPLSNVVGRYTMLGNPFASPIDWTSVLKTNIADTYWGWDPNLSSTGGYITVTSTGTTTLISPYTGTTGLNQYIQPGQGFFIQTTATSPQLIIREQDKVSNFNANAFRTRKANDVPLIAVNLLYDNAGTKVLADGVLAAFDTSFSGTVGKEDALKMINSAENISISNGKDLLSIDARKLPKSNDTLLLNVSKLTRPKYTLQIFVQQIGNHVQPYLVDAYLGSSKALSISDTNYIHFTVDVSKAASLDVNRFIIVFNHTKTTPITFIAVKAELRNKDAQIDWKVKEDITVQKYHIEHSTDNRIFEKKAEVIAKGNSADASYQWTHANLTFNHNYYRVRSIHADGTTLISKSVFVKIDLPAARVKVFPNPVKNEVMHVQMNNMERGQYQLYLINNTGYKVFSCIINHPGVSSSIPIQINPSLAKGIYYLRMTNDIKSYSTPVLIH